MSAKAATKAVKDENSYKSILKGTSIFGGVQLFHVLISIIRGKLVAMILGPAGMGVSALYVSSTATVQRFASLGLNLALVKETGEAREDEERLRHVISVSRRLVIITALLGALACMGLSGWLSVTSFGDTSHTLAFIALGIMVFFAVASGGESSILQGLHDVKRLSRATVFGSATGLLVSIPLYWLYGIDGIVPAMIILSLAVYVFYLVSSRSAAEGRKGGLTLRRSDWPLVKRLLGLGVMLMASDVAGTLGTYALQAYVRMTGDLADVGFFQGANSITMQYSGVVFAALSMDYFPRLSATVRDNRHMQEVICRQMEVVCCLIGPLAAILIVAAPLAIRIVLTKEFLHIVPLLRWMAFALLFQGLMFPMAYVTFAKNNRRVYFWMEVVGGNVMILVCSVIGYRIWGLTGLGIGSFIDKVFWLPATYLVNRRLYDVRLSREAAQAMWIAITGGCLVMAGSMWADNVWSVVTGITIILAMLLIALRRLRGWLNNKENGDNPPPGKLGKLLRRADAFLDRISGLARRSRGLLQQYKDARYLRRGGFPKGSENSIFAEKYYPRSTTSNLTEDCDNYPRGIVVKCDGRLFHGGPTDRLRGILTLYSEARKRGLDFYIYWTSPFPLEDYLIPATTDWRIRPDQLYTTIPQAFPVIVDDLTPEESRIRVNAALRYKASQYHFYTNADYGRGNYAALYRELFRPSEVLEREVKRHLAELGKGYFAFSFRFLQLLGDFREWDDTVLPEDEAIALMEKVAAEFDKIARDLPADSKILLTADSKRFLDFMRQRDPRIYIVDGDVRNIDLGKTPAPDAWLKTFTDQQLLMSAAHVWLLQTGGMYPSGFPRFAAEVGGVSFTHHVF